MIFSIVTAIDGQDKSGKVKKCLINLDKVETIGEYEGYSKVIFSDSSFHIKESIQQVITNIVSFKKEISYEKFI